MNSPRVGIIAALNPEGVVGHSPPLPGDKHGLPWHVPADLKMFKETTEGQAIVVGRNTFEAMGARPLPNRHTIVLSRRKSFWRRMSGFQNAHSGYSLRDAMETAKSLGVDELWIAGGQEVWETSLRFRHDATDLDLVPTQLKLTFVLKSLPAQPGRMVRFPIKALRPETWRLRTAEWVDRTPGFQGFPGAIMTHWEVDHNYLPPGMPDGWCRGSGPLFDQIKDVLCQQ